MSTSTDFLVRIIGDASKGIGEVSKFGDKVKTELDGSKSSFSTFASVAGGAIAALGLTAVANKVVDFGAQSVEAYKESEAAQQRLTDAYARFPALADVSIEKLQAMNSELGKKTRFDDDATASGQAVLAQFNLTGQQLQELTPLLQDYAAKTGKDLPTAAEDLGKAILGQGRSLKSIGIEFTDTGSAAGNFEQLMSGLRTQVGGFAESEATTAEGKAAILANQFGEVQETIGAQLLPVLMEMSNFLLSDVIPAIQGLADWLAENQWAIGVVAGVIGAVLVGAFIAWAGSIWAVNAALFASPITWIVLAIVALIAAIVLLVLNWDAVVAWITTIWSGFISWITAVINGFVAWWNSVWTAIGAVIGYIWNTYIVQPITAAINWVTSTISAGMSMISAVWNATWNGLGAVVRSIWNGVLGWIEGGVNGAIDLINGMIKGVNAVAGAVGIKIDLIPHVGLPRLATGGVTTGPMMAIIGDNPGGREYVEPVDQVAARLERVALAAASSAAPRSGGMSRMHPDDIRDLAHAIGDVVYPLIMSGAQKTVKQAFGG